MHDDSSPPASMDQNTQEDGVRNRLQREVASWSADRSGKAHADAAETLSVVKQPATRTKSRAKRAPKPAVAETVVDAPRKAFSMSYDGVSSREYLQQSLVRRHT